MSKEKEFKCKHCNMDLDKKLRIIDTDMYVCPYCRVVNVVRDKDYKEKKGETLGEYLKRKAKVNIE